MLAGMETPEIRQTIASQLRQSRAHAGLTSALAGFPEALAGHRAPGHAHTAWHLVEHMRLAADDLLAYCVDAGYVALGFPDGYWPESPAPGSSTAWSESCRRLLDATEKMASLVEDTEHDLYATVPTGQKPEHHTLRAALILLDHNGYHAAQLIVLRQALAVWPG